MNNISKAMENLKENEILLEMSSLKAKRTNLPVNIWLDDIGKERKTKHNLPRIKAQNNYLERNNEDTISIFIDKNSPKVIAGNSNLKQKDLNKIFKWIKTNYDLLMKHWNQEIDTIDFIQQMKEIN